MNQDEALAALSAMANESRLTVLKALVQAGPDGLSAGGIADVLGASPSQTSFHLSALTEAGLIQAERQSRHIIYRSNFATLGQLVAFILEDCCGGSPVARACCT